MLQLSVACSGMEKEIKLKFQLSVTFVGMQADL